MAVILFYSLEGGFKNFDFLMFLYSNININISETSDKTSIKNIYSWKKFIFVL